MTSLNINRSLLQFFPLCTSFRCDKTLGKHYIHSNSVLYSDRIYSTNVGGSNSIFQNFNQYLDQNHSEMNRAVVKYAEAVKPQDSAAQESSSYAEAFQWLLDENGKPIDFNQPVDLFKGIKLISRYIETKYNLNSESISDVKISNLISPYFDLEQEQNKVRIIDLYNHVSAVYNQNKQEILDKLMEEGNTLAVGTSSLATPTQPSPAERSGEQAENIKPGTISDILSSSKPLGSFGDITLNEVVVSLKKIDWQWRTIIDNTEVTLNALPLGMNFLSFGLVVRTYIKYVHNRPLNANLSSAARKIEQASRDRNLKVFVLLGAPLVIFSLKNSAIKLKLRDMGSVNVSLESITESQLSNSSNINSNLSKDSVLFWFITTLNNKIPYWLKFLFSFLINLRS